MARPILDVQPAEPLPKKGKGKAAPTLAALAGSAIDDLDSLRAAIGTLRAAMKAAAEELDFELAAQLRDRARQLEQMELQMR